MAAPLDRTGRRPRYWMRSFSVTKEGNGPAENDDAVVVDPKRCWMAVADGATDSSYAAEWAWFLARSFSLASRVHEDTLPIDKCRAVLAVLQRRWERGVPWMNLAARGSAFVEKALVGAFATFLGVRVRDRKWSAIVIGDCNLFVIDPTQGLRLAFPWRKAGDFGTTPDLVPSMPGRDVERALNAAYQRTEEWAPGEQLVACTDAVAAYLLRAEEAGTPAWSALLAIDSEAAFAEWVTQARGAGMRNDDATVAIAMMTEGSGDGVAAIGRG